MKRLQNDRKITIIVPMSVVTKNIPTNVIAAGISAKVVRTLD